MHWVFDNVTGNPVCQCSDCHVGIHPECCRNDRSVGDLEVWMDVPVDTIENLPKMIDGSAAGVIGHIAGS